MKKMIERIALLLALFTLASCLLCACGDKGEDPSSTEEGGPSAGEESRYDNLNGGGRDFIVLTRAEDGYLFAYEEVDVLVDTEADDRVNSAIYARDQHVNELLGVHVVGSKMTSGKMKTEIEKCHLGQLQTYDVLMGMVDASFDLAIKGYLYEWDRIPYVDMSQDYWMTSFYDATSIGGYNFFCPGAANISAYNTVGVTFFNKSMITAHTLEDPYALVKDGNWTIEAMQEMAKKVTSNSDGLDGMTYMDTYGLAVNSFVWQPFFYSSGYMMIEKDENDIPFLSATNKGMSEVVYTILSTITSMVNDTSMALLSNRTEHTGASYQAPNLETDIFLKNRSLFWVENMYGQYSLRDMENYGILPMPKWNSAAEHVSCAHAGHSSATSIPLTAPDLSLSGAVIEEMASYSIKYLIPEFYEQTIRVRGVRDEQSYEMMDIIYQTVIIDLAVVMKPSGLGLDNAIRGMLNFNDTGFSSMFGSQGSGYEITIGKLASDFANHAANQYAGA